MVNVAPAGSDAAASVKAGDALDVMSPMGAFVSKHGRDGKSVEQNVMNSMNHPENMAGESATTGASWLLPRARASPR